MSIQGVPGGSNNHYRPNLQPDQPGQVSKGTNHKLEPLKKTGEGNVTLGFASLDSTKAQVDSLHTHSFRVQDTAKEVSVTNLAQQMIQPHDSF